MKNSSCESLNLQSGAKFLYQYAAVLTANLIAVSVGMNQGWSSIFLPQLLSQNSEVPTTNTDGSWIVVMTLLGLPIGYIIITFSVDQIGRKICILIISPLSLVSWLLIAYGTNVYILCVARFLLGIAEGATYTTLPMYVGEITDKTIRGWLGSFLQIATKIGALLVTIFGLYFDMRTAALIACTIPILHLLTFIWMPESPYFFILQNKFEQAARIFKEFSKEPNDGAENAKLSITLTSNVKMKRRFLNVFKNKMMRRTLAVLVGVRLVQQCSGYVAITFYCLTIFNEAGGSVKGSTATLIYFSVQLIAGIVSGVLVDRTGRKPLLIISVIGSGCTCASQALYFYFKTETNVDLSRFSFVPLAALILYISFYTLGLSIVPPILMGEYFPIGVKVFGVCIANVSFCIFGIVVSKFFQIVKEEYGMHVPFFAFAVCCAFGLIFIYYFVPETKGKTLEEIQKDCIDMVRSKEMTHHDAGDSLMVHKL